MAKLKSNSDLKKIPKVGFISFSEINQQNKSLIELGEKQEEEKFSKGYKYIKKGKCKILTKSWN